MGKRSDFERRKNDFYATPERGVMHLHDHFKLPDVRYIEPCAGDGTLIKHMATYGAQCVMASDIDPLEAGENVCKSQISTLDVFDADWEFLADQYHADYFITNPPWTRSILHPLIEILSDVRPTWLLFDANWLNTKQARPFSERLVRFAPVGRLKWIKDSKNTGKDDSAWYLFDKPDPIRLSTISLHGPEFKIPQNPRKRKPID